MRTEYKSPFQTRYKNNDLSRIWSEKNTRRLWRKAWIELIKYQWPALPENLRQPWIDAWKDGRIISQFKEVTAEEIERAKEIEKDIHHDLFAEIAMLREKYPGLGKIIHMGVTSSNIQDYATIHQIRTSLFEIKRLVMYLQVALRTITKNSDDVVMLGYTHLRKAEPTTLGYRFGYFHQRIKKIIEIWPSPPDPKMFGATGTNSNHEMLQDYFGKEYSKESELTPVGKEIRFQTYPRNYDYKLASFFAQIALVLHKLSLDIRFLYSQDQIGINGYEDQVGSSAMPGKRNPIGWEKISGLSRNVKHISNQMWDIGANSMMERTLDDSSPRRFLLPELFMTMAEILQTATDELPKITCDPFKLKRETFEEWKVWLPSRIQTLLQYSGIDVERKELENFIETSGNIVNFFRNAVPHKKELQHHRITNPNTWLYLDGHVKETLENL